ncbi:MAG: hypothetical protein KBA51_06810 [Kiritimatiellae bacterium]|nr:hypothetical protein [Kiritimatiellia bacterium]
MTDESRCPGCGRDALTLARPRYDGFKRVGEDRVCVSCGYVYPPDAGAPKPAPNPRIFTDADRSAPIHAFAEGEADALCRRCAHYVVNPFRQWCGLHQCEVEATDTCDQFERRPEPPATPEPPADSRPKL